MGDGYGPHKAGALEIDELTAWALRQMGIAASYAGKKAPLYKAMRKVIVRAYNQGWKDHQEGMGGW